MSSDDLDFLRAKNKAVEQEIIQQREYWADQYVRWRHERDELLAKIAELEGEEK